MNRDAKELIRTCELCQKNARSHRQDKVEISHKNMFNQHPGHTVHVDFCEYGGSDYIVSLNIYFTNTRFRIVFTKVNCQSPAKLKPSQAKA